MDFVLFFLLLVFSSCIGPSSCITDRLIKMENFCAARTGKRQGVELIWEDTIASGNSAFQCCAYLQAAHSSQQLLINFRKINVDTADGTNGAYEDADVTLATTNWCTVTGCTARLNFYDSWAAAGTLLACTCKDLFPATFETPSNRIKVCLDIPARMEIVTDFAFFASSFDESSCTQNQMLKCVNGRCVQNTLACDGVDNCGDRTDELFGGCEDTSAPVGEFNDDSSSLNLDWWWIPLAVIAAMMTLYWCCWRPGYLWWRLGMCRDLIPFLKSLCLCIFTCTCAMNCGGTTCGRHPYKAQMAQQSLKMQSIGGRRRPPKPKKKEEKTIGMMSKSKKGPITKQPKGLGLAMIEESDKGKSGKRRGGPKDKVYNVKVEYEDEDKGKDRMAAVLVDEFPEEEWSGMHVREGR